jgi:two-component system sensor histidine kinase QseC
MLKPSIARRTFLALSLACIVVWASIYLQGMQLMLAEGGNFDDELRWVGEASVELAHAHPDPTELRMIVAGWSVLVDDPDPFIEIRISDAEGSVLIGAHLPAISAGPGDAAGPGWYEDDAQEPRWRAYVDWTADRRWRVQVTQSLQLRQREFDRVMLSAEALVLPLLLGIPTLMLPVWLAVYTGLSPLRRLVGELAERRPGDLSRLQTPAVHAELAPVVDELSSTLGRLQALLQRERQFLADAAHELRTPIGLVSAQVDTLLHAGSSTDREEAARRLHQGVGRASRLVNQLLALARLDSAVEATPRSVDVADLARDSLAAHAEEASRKQIELGYVGPDSLVQTLPGDALESILNNLVGNAVRYGLTEGRVRVELSPLRDGTVELCVSDDGAGVSEQDRERIFERFRRGADAQGSGSGLGLAIVKSATEQLGAGLSLEAGLDGRGCCFRLQWRRSN